VKPERDAKGPKVTDGWDQLPYGGRAQRDHTAPMTSSTSTSTPSNHFAAATGHEHVGDLARRVTHRRNQLGLSTEELARRAGVDAWFLAYFEQSSDTTLSAGALLRLAVALDTTPLSLEGGEVDRPPGSGRAGTRPVLENLTGPQCEGHLAPGGIGRIVLSTGSGPVAYPVNFLFSDGTVVFRTSDSMVDAITGVVAFEVDHIDEAMSEGWSVLVRGHARLIEGVQERQKVALLNLEPWAGGARLNVVEIVPFEMTGRVIVQQSN
jgi:nitroimidazol reductase NimA-like FMN-containing flavoprotein (pyridoxamine 5'-phosphate oxidase superfamily)